MAVWTLTKARIVNQLETLVRRLTGREILTSIEKQIISDGFNAAIQDICLDAGISRWRFIQADKAVTTTAGTGYVDLDENIFNIVSGTVRIASENTTLGYVDLEYIYAVDPERTETDLPLQYSFDASADAETVRMILYPVPGAAYTISFVAEVIPEADSISSFPAWMHAGLKDKAAENALRDLGLIEHSFAFGQSYQRRKQNAKASQGHDGPIHIPRAISVVDSRLHSRIPE